MSTVRDTPPASLQSIAASRVKMPRTALWLHLILTAAAIVLSLLLRPWLPQVGVSPYQQFLRSEWVLFAGGKGINLDILSLPLAPLLHIAAASVLGCSTPFRIAGGVH